MSKSDLKISDVIWVADEKSGTFQAQVVRSGPRRCQLRLVEVASGNVLREGDFGLTYDTLFGPDAMDVRIWNVTASRWVEEHRMESRTKT